jgi:succinate dehydrogenase hydrophobic anchor subunit
VVAAAALLIGWQLFVPPIVGLADQGDFARMIGLFGFGPADKTTEYAYVAGKYVPDPNARLRVYEQASSEYLFVEAAVLLNKIVSKDGSLDITVMGFVHLLAFLCAFWCVLRATGSVRAGPLLWILALLIFTDVGYVAYWNSFYAEPASCVFFLLLLAESVVICRVGEVSGAQAVRWTLWAFLFVAAKPVNTPIGILLAIFEFRLWAWSKSAAARRVAIAGAGLILAAGAVNVFTVPTPNTWPTVYDQVFLAILPEAKNPAQDARELGLPQEWLKYAGTGAWSQGNNLYQGVVTGLIGKQITNADIARFYLRHPGRIWRHAKRILPVAFSLRPEWCGNFERSAGLPAGAKSKAFNVWSGFHEHWLGPIGKPILMALLLAPFLAIGAWLRWPEARRIAEFIGLLGICCLISFTVAITGDAWDNVKHLYMFNLLLDTWLVALIAILCQSARKVLYGI